MQSNIPVSTVLSTYKTTGQKKSLIGTWYVQYDVSMMEDACTVLWNQWKEPKIMQQQQQYVVDSNTNKNSTYISTIRISNGWQYHFVETNDHLFDREDVSMMTDTIMVRDVWHTMESMHQKL